MRHFITFTVLLLTMLISCEKDEITVPKLDRGNTVTQSVLKTTYGYQQYFDLETNRFVKDNEKTEWDVAFGCGAHSELVLTNTSKSIAVAKRVNADFDAVTTVDNLEFVYESSTGHPDSTAFHNWTYEDIFVINLGYDELGNAQGYGKIKLINNTETEVSFEYGLLNDIEPKTINIIKDDDYNAVFFSINNESIVEVEPPKADWDLCFTQYIYYFHEFETPYLVTGILLNRSQTNAYRHDSENYESLGFDDIDPDNFTSNLDAIGYDWKVFNNANYTVFSEFNYIINSFEGFYYKLHFIDFYSEQGEKGFPKFEFQKI